MGGLQARHCQVVTGQGWQHWLNHCNTKVCKHTCSLINVLFVTAALLCSHQCAVCHCSISHAVVYKQRFFTNFEQTSPVGSSFRYSTAATTSFGLLQLSSTVDLHCVVTYSNGQSTQTNTATLSTQSSTGPGHNACTDSLFGDTLQGSVGSSSTSMLPVCIQSS